MYTSSVDHHGSYLHDFSNSSLSHIKLYTSSLEPQRRIALFQWIASFFMPFWYILSISTFYAIRVGAVLSLPSWVTFYVFQKHGFNITYWDNFFIRASTSLFTFEVLPRDAFLDFLWQIIRTGGHFWRSILCDAKHHQK